LIKQLRASGFRGKIAVTAHRPDDAVRLKDSDADVILSPFADAAETIPARLSMLKIKG
jgi:hypothetical protein